MLVLNFLKSTRLNDAADAGDLEGVKRELARGASVNERGMMKTTPLMNAAAKGRTQVVQHLLSFADTDVNTLNAGGTNALMAACRGGKIDVVRILLEDPRTDVNCLGKFGGTALMNAAGFGHTEIVKELLKVEDISLAPTYTDKKHSPITIARQNGFEEIASLLEEFESSRAAPKPVAPSTPKPPKPPQL